jgi:DEAD/DEAH box helicase domain-containing protein
LRYIVIDEVHTYRGVFGANMAQLLRRMLRMAHHYGANPQFICGSATIANPQELAQSLTGQPFAVVDQDGAGSGRRYFVLWNPPLVGEAEANLRRSYADESVDLMLHCLRAELNTIVFARARKLTERMLRVGQASVSETGEDQLLQQISSYRAGYLAEEREEIETKLKLGEIRGIITTNALEMGIDIGGLDAAILSGYPGTIMSTWQQAGRAGRRGRDALVLLVASQNSLDQYYVNHPRDFFGRPHEIATVDLNNQHIRIKHLLCAAKELHFGAAEYARLPVETRDLLRAMQEVGLLKEVDGEGEGEEDGWRLEYPEDRREVHFEVSLRAASHETYRIIEENRGEGPNSAEIGTIEPPNVFREAHPGAIYQHGGDDYRVVRLDRQRRTVVVREENALHYTRSNSSLNVTLDTVRASRALNLEGLPCTVALGDVLVQETVHSYQELQLGSDAMVRRVNLDYPLTMQLHTTAMWLALPDGLRELGAEAGAEAGAQAGAQAAQEVQGEASEEDEDLGRDPLAAGLHAMQHLLSGVMPLLVMCDPRDVSGFEHLHHPGVGAPAVFIYDAYQGGIGLAEIAYARAEEMIHLAYGAVANCGCRSGCPSCVQSGSCRLRNENLDKPMAQAILGALLGPQQAQIVSASATAWEPAALAHSRPALTVESLAASRQRVLADLAARTMRGTLAAHLSTPDQRPIPQAEFHKGDQVFHTTFGRGQVVDSRFQGSRELVNVRFVRRRGSTREVDASTGMLQKLGTTANG